MAKMNPCKASEPRVIDNEMISQCLDEQGMKGEMGRLAREEGITWDEITKIRLEFLSILRIDHLWVLPNLTFLSMSNNFIEQIEQLDMLVHLRQLDLSFNKITKIENLEELPKLEVLNLFGNLISVIENIDHLKHLEVFSIGNNLIEDEENIFYLRRFNRLRSVNLAGNPIAEMENFRNYIATFLPKVIYYEYRMIDDEERQAGAELYAEKVAELEEAEADLLERLEREEAEAAEAELHSESFVEFLGSNHLFLQMFEGDKEGKLLLLVEPEEAKQYYEELEAQMVEIMKQIFEFGQEQYLLRKAEVAAFKEITEGAKRKNQEESIAHMESFTTIKDDIFKKIHAEKEQVAEKEIEPLEYHDRIARYRVRYDDWIHKTWKTLMGMEIVLFEQMEEANTVFEQTMTEMINNFLEMAQAQFSQIRALQTIYNENVIELALRYLTNLNLIEDMEPPEELAPMFVDRDTLGNALAASNDLHLLVIDNREDRLVRRSRNWLSSLVNDLQKDEILRDRAKVLEVNHFLDIQREDFEEVIQLPEINLEI